MSKFYLIAVLLCIFTLTGIDIKADANELSS